METPSINPNTTQAVSNRDSRGDSRQPKSDRNLAGLVVILVGAFFLAKEFDMDLPRWLFSFPMLLIALGVFIGAKHNFRTWKWLIPVAIGSFLLFDNFWLYDLHLARYFWPITIIAVGVALLFKKKGTWNQHGFGGTAFDSSEDAIESVTIFGGVKKNIISKNFRGGEATTVFGGTELNMIQADTQSQIVLELTQIFGGTKLIVPAHWRIQTDELVTIFGGLNDKRPLPPQGNTEQARVLIIRGTCIFGGIDIKSY
jgi:hypothetical protein